MKTITAALMFLLAGSVHAASAQVNVEQLPVLSAPTAPLAHALTGWRDGIVHASRSCLKNASAAGVSGSFQVTIRKSFENQKIVVLVAKGDSFCGEAYPDSFEYGIAFDGETGKRVHLEDAYPLAVRQKGGTVLTSAAVAPVLTAYREANQGTPECLSGDVANKDTLTQAPLTMSVDAKGTVTLYMSVIHALQGCFGPISLSRSQVQFFRNPKVAQAYSLP